VMEWSGGGSHIIDLERPLCRHIVEQSCARGHAQKPARGGIGARA